MADYYPLLSRASAGKDAAERAAIYDRARGALERQLGAFDPPLEPEAIRAELAALEAVILRVEQEAGAPTAEAAPEPAGPAASPDTAPAWAPPPEAPRPLPATPVSAAPAPAMPEASAPEVATPRPERSGRSVERPKLPLATPPAEAEAAAGAPGPAVEPEKPSASLASQEPPPGEAAMLAPVAEAGAGPGGAEQQPAPDLPDEPASPAEAPSSTDLPSPPPHPMLRPRVPARDEAPRPKKRVALFAALAAAAMVAMGLTALSLRDSGVPTAPRSTAGSAATAEEGEEPKIEGRLATSEPAPRPAPEKETQQPVPQPPRPAEPQRQASAEPPARSGTAEAPATTSRAFMVLESGGGAPNQFEGLASWAFAPDPALRGQKSLKTIVAFPQANLTIDIALARNADAGINASHTVMVVFESGGALENVREMSPIEWRERESQAGQSLAGIVVPVQDNVFMIGLDRSSAAQQRNLDILRLQRWMVFEIRLANGRRGAVLVEKGAPGERAIAEALTEWR